MRLLHAGAVLLGLGAAACGAVSDTPVDAGPVAIDAPVGDRPPGLGSERNPADSCEQLRVLAGPISGVFWVKHPDGVSPPLEVYCEQQLNQGGWAMVYNSVLTEPGVTTAFWRISYVERLRKLGTAAADQNYYDGRLYSIGVDYMDVIVDLEGTSAIAALVHADGVNQETMAFENPRLTAGNPEVFRNHFASGWSSLDADHDPYGSNCAAMYDNVTQHYGGCWVYNLGADADTPTLDGGVGPHVHGPVLTALGLAQQPSGGGYSRVRRIARFTRW